jgi:hypothetical protein
VSHASVSAGGDAPHSAGLTSRRGLFHVPDFLPWARRGVRGPALR